MAVLVQRPRRVPTAIVEDADLSGTGQRTRVDSNRQMLVDADRTQRYFFDIVGRRQSIEDDMRPGMVDHGRFRHVVRHRCVQYANGGYRAEHLAHQRQLFDQLRARRLRRDDGALHEIDVRCVNKIRGRGETGA